MAENEPEARTAVGCKHCPTRELCQCPAGPEKCALRDCPCDELCPCPHKLERPDDNCCPWPAACGWRGAAGGLATLVGAVVLTALGWAGAPFAAMALLLILIPVALGIVLVIGSMGRFGRRAAVPFVFPGWAAIVFALFGLGLIAAGIAALVGDESLASLPLLIVAMMFLLIARRGRTVLVCRLMPAIVILGIVLAAGTGVGFGIAAIVRADEPLAGIGLLGIGLALALTVLWPWWSTCRGDRHAHLGAGVAWLFLVPWLVMMALVGFVVIGGLDPDEQITVLDDIDTTDTDDAQTDDTALDTTDTQTDDPPLDDTQADNPPLDDTQTDDAIPVDPQCVTAAEAAGVDHVVIEDAWQGRMEGTPDWQSITAVPTDLGPSITSYGAAMSGPYLVVLVKLDATPVDTGIVGAGTQLGVGFAIAADAPVAGSGGFAEGFGHLWFLTPGGGLEGFDAAAGFTPLEGGTGAISGSCAIWRVPAPAPPLFVRFNNFWRHTRGSEASADDPTAFQASMNYRLDGGVLAPA